MLMVEGDFKWNKAKPWTKMGGCSSGDGKQFVEVEDYSSVDTVFSFLAALFEQVTLYNAYPMIVIFQRMYSDISNNPRHEKTYIGDSPACEFRMLQQLDCLKNSSKTTIDWRYDAILFSLKFYMLHRFGRDL